MNWVITKDEFQSDLSYTYFSVDAHEAAIRIVRRMVDGTTVPHAEALERFLNKRVFDEKGLTGVLGVKDGATTYAKVATTYAKVATLRGAGQRVLGALKQAQLSGSLDRLLLLVEPELQEAIKALSEAVEEAGK